MTFGFVKETWYEITMTFGFIEKNSVYGEGE
jgi:hypothetical protein